MQVKIRKAESGTQAVKTGKKPLSYYIPVWHKIVRGSNKALTKPKNKAV